MLADVPVLHTQVCDSNAIHLTAAGICKKTQTKHLSVSQSAWVVVL